MNYFASFAPGTACARDHLRDEDEFLALARRSKKRCKLKPVSFIKPIGEENEHPGYASESTGSDHLVELLQAIENSRCRQGHDGHRHLRRVRRPVGSRPAAGPGRQGRARTTRWGPGTRIPALVLSPGLPGNFAVDHTQHDTTSILATIEHRFGLAPLTSRDAAVRDLGSALRAGR